MADTLARRVTDMIQSRLAHAVREAVVCEDTRLFEGGLNFDSITTMELISLTEQTFGVQYEHEDLTETNFQTPHSISLVLARRGAN